MLSLEPMADALEELRAGIDVLDERLVELLNERAKVVVQIGQVKQEQNTPIYAPHREAAVLARVLRLNRGPLPDRTIEGVFREIMSGSFTLEKPLAIGYLGPAGSFSHVAAKAQFGSSVDFQDLHDIATVFAQVAHGEIDYGVVPIENSTGGGITDSLDAFFAAAGDLHIYAEVQVFIRHHLLANCAPRDVKRIYSKPQIFTQCRKWLQAHYPNAEIVNSSSSSRAVLTAKEESGAAAIASSLAGSLYGVNPLYLDIEDNPNNITRFLILAKQQAKPSGDDKTSMMFTTKHEPGALVRVLKIFDETGINLTHIDKRPSQRENWTYTFFVDAEGHQDEPHMKEAMSCVRAHCQEFALLGSYPRSRRIL
ncbi:MAG: prephenate dehydratase [Myxococcales bacterium]|nr:prephenate dehydratase [Myxococcales bacterium]